MCVCVASACVYVCVCAPTRACVCVKNWGRERGGGERERENRSDYSVITAVAFYNVAFVKLRSEKWITICSYVFVYINIGI